MSGVVRLEDGFAAIGQIVCAAGASTAIAEQESESAKPQIFLMVLGDSVGDDGDAGAILAAMPPCAVRAQACGKSLIDFGVGERLGLAVVPSETGEGGQVAREILFNVDAKPVLARDVPGVIRDVGHGNRPCSYCATASR